MTTSHDATMGKQVNFYMTDGDERRFIEFVRSDRNVVIFKSVTPTTEIADLQVLPPPGEPFWFSLCLWDKDHSPPPRLTYIQQQRHYSVEEFESEVIQFHRCGMDEGRLVRGRIWAEMKYWQQDDPPTMLRKSHAFSAWYQRLATWIKRHSSGNEKGGFIMPGAAQFAGQGGMICQAVLASGRAL